VLNTIADVKTYATPALRCAATLAIGSRPAASRSIVLFAP
jgi:hypothetical protein